MCLIAALVLSFSSCGGGYVKELSADYDNKASLEGVHNRDAYIGLSLRLLKAAASRRGENAVVSPYSAVYGLALLSKCADGGSLAQIEDASGYTRDGLISEARYLSESGKDEKDAVIKLSGAAIVKDSIEQNVKSVFLQNNADTLGARVFSASAGKKTAKYVNGWCSDETGGTVKGAVADFEDEDMIIVSPFLFDSQWSENYEEKDIKTRSFKNYDGTSTDVKILCSKEDFIKSDEYIGFSKTYKNEKYCFTVIMPRDESRDIYDFLDSINEEKWAQIYDDRSGALIAVRIPEFSVNCVPDMTEILIGVGITDVFDKGKADLSGMLSGSASCGGFIEGARVDINRKGLSKPDSSIFKERGTELIPEEYDIIFVDRPFVFAVTDSETLAPIYIGVIANMNGVQ